MKDKWSSADMDMSYIKQGRFDILAAGIERCLHSLGIEDLRVTCEVTKEDRFEIKLARKEDERNILKNTYEMIIGRHCSRRGARSN